MCFRLLLHIFLFIYVSIYTMASFYTLLPDKKVNVVSKLLEQRDWFPRFGLSTITFIRNDIIFYYRTGTLNSSGRANVKNDVLMSYIWFIFTLHVEEMPCPEPDQLCESNCNLLAKTIFFLNHVKISACSLLGNARQTQAALLSSSGFLQKSVFVLLQRPFVNDAWTIK